MKKFFALLLSMLLVMSVATAFAAAPYNVTITPDTSDTATHEYEAYQIFAGDLVEDTGVLSNITWGTGIDQTKLGTLATAINALRDTTAEGYVALTASSTAAQFADAISGLGATTDDATAQAVADALAAALSNTTAGTKGSDGVSGLDAGYYFIQDSKAPVGTGAKTRYILQVVKTVTVQEKASVPSVVKKVQDVNDSTGDKSAYQDSADYDIGDAVPFQITATTASKVHDYKTYHVTIEDKQSAGLDAPTKFHITVLGLEFDLDYNATEPITKTTTNTSVSVQKVTADAGQTFAIKVTFTNTTSGSKIDSEADSKPIVVTYTSVLNSNAEIGATGNPNETYLKYSNNPNSSDDNEEGTTPEDKVIVFTYKPLVNKVDKENKPLDGAGFTLYKKVTEDYVANSGETKKLGSVIKSELAAVNPSINASALADDSYYIVKAMTKVSGTQTFEFKGIDDGTYVLVETTIPDGYNAFASETIVVSATHTQDDGTPPISLTALTADNVFTTANTTDGKLTGELTGNVVNNQGAVLPSTGGSGVYWIYGIGAVLVIIAAVLLVTKKRVSAE